MIGGNKTNKQIQTATTPSKFKAAVKHGFIYAAILCLATMFIIAVSILSDISYNRGHYAYAATTAYSDKELLSISKQYYWYQMLQACSSQYRNKSSTQHDTAGITCTVKFDKPWQSSSCSNTNYEVRASSGDMTNCDIIGIADKIESNGSDKIIAGFKNLASNSSIFDGKNGEIPKVQVSAKGANKGEKGLIDLLDNGVYSGITVRADFMPNIIKKASINKPKMNQAAWWVFWNSKLKHCGSLSEVEYTVEDHSGFVKMPVKKNGTWTTVDAKITYNNGMNANSKVTIYSDAKNPSGNNVRCSDIAEEMNDNVDAYIDNINKYEQLHPDEAADDDTTSSLIDSDDSSDDSEEDPCEAGFLGFGWLFCPGANLVDSFLNGFLNWIDDQLNWTLLAENEGEIRNSWQNFLNVANVVFAIAFLVMIYSMATSTGLSNYDVKKMLPRLIVAAIAVNLSFYICAAIVDIFNIIGNGIYGIINPGGSTWDVSVGVDGLVGISTNIVAVVGVVFIFGLSAIVALAVIFVCLCVREIALIVLVVISPLAFVCYLLPNTQKWFQRWSDYFVRLLLVYPMFMAVWGAARWVANLRGTATGDESTMPGFVISLTCMIAPAVAVVPLFKMSGGIMGMAASRVAGSKLAAKGNAAQSYMRGKGAGVAKNNFATRAATSRLSNRLGRFGANNANAPNSNGIRGMVGGGIRRWAGRKALMASNASNEHSHAIANELRSLDNAAMETAKNNTSSMPHDDLMAIATTGMLNDRAVDQYTLRAATDAVAESMNEDQVKDMMLRRAAVARQLAENHRDAEARALLNNAADAAGKSGSYLGSKGSLQSFRNGQWSGDASDYSNAVTQKAASLSPQALSNMSVGAMKHVRNEVNNNTSGDRDKAVQNLRSAAATIQNNSKLLSGLSSAAIGELNATSQTLRTVSQAAAEHHFGLDKTLTDLSSDDPATKQAGMMGLNRIRDDLADTTGSEHFNDLSHYDQQRLRQALNRYIR